MNACSLSNDTSKVKISSKKRKCMLEFKAMCSPKAKKRRRDPRIMSQVLFLLSALYRYQVVLLGRQVILIMTLTPRALFPRRTMPKCTEISLSMVARLTCSYRSSYFDYTGVYYHYVRSI